MSQDQVYKGCAPNLYTAESLSKWHVMQSIDGEHWSLSRPMGYMGLYGLKQRIKLAWSVFTGRYDALRWPE